MTDVGFLTVRLEKRAPLAPMTQQQGQQTTLASNMLVVCVAQRARTTEFIIVPANLHEVELVFVVEKMI
jgi:Tfp pilus assembly PilM family ATPase